MTNFRNDPRFTITKHCYAIANAGHVLSQITKFRECVNVHVADAINGRTYTLQLVYNGLERDPDIPGSHQYIFRFQRMTIGERHDLAFIIRDRHPSRLRKVKSVKQLCRLIDNFMEEHIEPQFRTFVLGNSWFGQAYYNTKALKYVREYRQRVLRNSRLHLDYRDGDTQDSITNAWKTDLY